MHMGGMKFKQRGREEQAEADGMEEGERVAKLLGCDVQELYKNLLKPRIKVGNEFVTQGRNKDQVANSIGALCKGVFDRLFKWLVKKCNETLDTKQKRQHFIGVLDIAGFEIFEVSIKWPNQNGRKILIISSLFIHRLSQANDLEQLFRSFPCTINQFFLGLLLYFDSFLSNSLCHTSKMVA